MKLRSESIPVKPIERPRRERKSVERYSQSMSRLSSPKPSSIVKTLSTTEIMPVHIPFHVQENIIKMLPVKSLLQFRSVSKSWKSLIDSSDFVVAYSLTRQTNQQHHSMLWYTDVFDRYKIRHLLVDDDDDDDDDDDTLPRPKYAPDLPLSITLLDEPIFVGGTSHGLFCFYDEVSSDSYMAFIWNPSIRKSIDVPMPKMLINQQYLTHVRFGVRPDTLDPIIINMIFNDHFDDPDVVDTVPWEVEVFTLSSRTWRRALCSYRHVLSGRINFERPQVVIGKFIYWLGLAEVDNYVFSFDMVTEEFARIILPDCLNYLVEPSINVSISKLGNSVVVSGCDYEYFEVWVMEHDVSTSFSRLYAFDVDINRVLGFRKNGALIVEIKDLETTSCDQGTVAIFDPDLKHFNRIGVCGQMLSFEAHFYTETLLLL